MPFPMASLKSSSATLMIPATRQVCKGPWRCEGRRSRVARVWPLVEVPFSALNAERALNSLRVMTSHAAN
jgi:hypothetical protein